MCISANRRGSRVGSRYRRPSQSDSQTFICNSVGEKPQASLRDSSVCMGSVVKFLKETYGKQTLWEAVKSGGWKAALDGNVAHTTLIHGPNGTFVGEDELGNRYYENNDNQIGRHRWVVYKDLSWPLGQEATSIAPDWHGWIHCLYDVPPSHKDFKRPVYALKHKPNKSGGGERYLPKGSWFNPKKRNWVKTQFWVPPKTDGIVPPNA